MENNFNNLLLAAINNIAKEKKIDKEIIRDFLLESIKKAFIKSTYEDNIELSLDLDTGKLEALKLFTVVEDDDNFDEYINILENDSRIKDKNLKLGDIYKESFDISKEFRPQQVGQILQSFKQKITEISNQRVYKSWTPMINEVIMAEIEKEDKSEDNEKRLNEIKKKKIKEVIFILLILKISMINLEMPLNQH